MIDSGGLVATELMTREPQSNIEKHIVFLDMLQRGEVLRGELIRKTRPEELKAILELCLNMKEGNLTMPTRNPHRTISQHWPTEIFHCPIRKNGC